MTSTPAEQLAAVAEKGADAVLTAPDRSREIHASGGAITHVEGVAGVPGGDVLVVRELFLDAVREFLHPAAGPPVRWRSSRNPRPSDTAGVRLGIPFALAEAARRQEYLGRLQPVITPETPLARPAGLPGAAVRITPEQWAVLTCLDTPATPRELAAALGDSVFRTVCRAHELLALGLLAAPNAPTAPARTAAFLTGPG